MHHHLTNICQTRWTLTLAVTLVPGHQYELLYFSYPLSCTILYGLSILFTVKYPVHRIYCGLLSNAEQGLLINTQGSPHL